MTILNLVRYLVYYPKTGTFAGSSRYTRVGINTAKLFVRHHDADRRKGTAGVVIPVDIAFTLPENN